MPPMVCVGQLGNLPAERDSPILPHTGPGNNG